MLRDEIENFFLSVSCFETRSRISSFQYHALIRDREFLSFGLMLRDETKKNVEKMHFCWGMASLFFSPDIEDTRDLNKDSLKYKYITQFTLLEFGSMRPSTAWVVDEKYWSIRSLVKIIFLNFYFHFCQNVTFQQDNVWGGWKWLLKVWSKLEIGLLRFPAKPFKPVYTDILKPSHTHLTIKRAG